MSEMKINSNIAEITMVNKHIWEYRGQFHVQNQFGFPYSFFITRSNIITDGGSTYSYYKRNFYDDEGVFWKENEKIIEDFSNAFKYVEIAHNGNNIEICLELEDNTCIDDVLQEMLVAEVFIDTLALKFFAS